MQQPNQEIYIINRLTITSDKEGYRFETFRLGRPDIYHEFLSAIDPSKYHAVIANDNGIVGFLTEADTPEFDKNRPTRYINHDRIYASVPELDGEFDD